MHTPPYLTAVDSNIWDGTSVDFLWSRYTEYAGAPLVDPSGEKAFALDYTSNPSHVHDSDTYTLYVFNISSGNVAAGSKFPSNGGAAGLGSVSADGTAVYASLGDLG